mgnify:CR=1 FL=1
MSNGEVKSSDIKKIINRIRSWLSIIPGVNSYYVDQEAKIKTEKILENFNLKKEGD